MTLVATAGWADGGTSSCNIKLEKDDQLVRGKDLEIAAGDVVHDAIVIDGNLTLKKGAHVHNAMVSGGKLKVADGAQIDGDVVVFDGKAYVAKGATVKGSQVIVGKQVKVVGETGEQASFNITIEGKSLSSVIAGAVLKELRDCKVE